MAGTFHPVLISSREQIRVHCGNNVHSILFPSVFLLLLTELILIRSSLVSLFAGKFNVRWLRGGISSTQQSYIIARWQMSALYIKGSSEKLETGVVYDSTALIFNFMQHTHFSRLSGVKNKATENNETETGPKKQKCLKRLNVFTVFSSAESKRWISLRFL